MAAIKTSHARNKMRLIEIILAQMYSVVNQSQSLPAGPVGEV